MKTFLKLSFASALVLSIAFSSSCNKEEEQKDTDTQAAADNEQAEFISNDALTKADAATKGQSSFKVAEDAQLACATVTRDTTTQGTNTVTIDFGATNTMCSDGRERRGKIILTYTGSYYAVGTRNITFDNYYVNNFKVEGNHTVTSNGRDSVTGRYTWTINADNMKITRPDGKFHTWKSTRTRTMTAGDATLFNFADDVYEITGTAQGTNVNGLSYDVKIDRPLKIVLTCHYIVSGQVTITPSGKPARTVDFGSGTCDNSATVTINGQTYALTLH